MAHMHPLPPAPPPHQYFHPFLHIFPPSPSLVLPPRPLPFNQQQLLPQVAAEKRGRSQRKKEPKIGSTSSRKKNDSSSSAGSKKCYRACLSRAASSERGRRQALRDSIVMLKELLPIRCRSTILRQMDKCTVLKEACKHILDLKEEVQVLLKKKEELIISRTAKAAAELRYDALESMEVKEAEGSSIADCKKEDAMECSKRGAMFQEVVCDASNVFVTLRVPEGGGVRLSRVVGAVEKANVDIVNAVASWTGGDQSFCLLAQGKVRKPWNIPCYFPVFSNK